MEASTQHNGEEVRDVPIGEAFAESAGIDQAGGDQPRPRPVQKSESDAEDGAATPAQQHEDDLDLLAPKAASREWTFGPEDQPLRYVQRELSVVGKAQWFALVGEILDKALSGDSALSLNSLFAVPQPREGNLRPQDFQDADLFVHAVGKLLVYTPEFLEKSVCIWLNVPDYEWPLVRDLMKQSPDQGGMTDDMFEEVFSTFIDQNYKSIDAFFRERFPRLRGRWQARAKEASRSRSSRR